MKPITETILHQIFPATPIPTMRNFVAPLNKVCHAYDITTVARAAAFIAQIGHESGGLVAVRENLNYSAETLRKVFPKYFPNDAMAAKYARKPEAIANIVYANRMGNGDTKSGDGWTYKGRGLIQLTGKSNYSNFAKSLKMSLEDVVAYLETPEGAAMSAGWFWSTHSLNTLADQNKFLDITKRINGGTNGLAHRQELYAKAKQALV